MESRAGRRRASRLESYTFFQDYSKREREAARQRKQQERIVSYS